MINRYINPLMLVLLLNDLFPMKIEVEVVSCWLRHAGKAKNVEHTSYGPKGKI
jgi:hypothetical protein